MRITTFMVTAALLALPRPAVAEIHAVEVTLFMPCNQETAAAAIAALGAVPDVEEVQPGCKSCASGLRNRPLVRWLNATAQYGQGAEVNCTDFCCVLLREPAVVGIRRVWYTVAVSRFDRLAFGRCFLSSRHRRKAIGQRIGTEGDDIVLPDTPRCRRGVPLRHHVNHGTDWHRLCGGCGGGVRAPR